MRARGLARRGPPGLPARTRRRPDRTPTFVGPRRRTDGGRSSSLIFTHTKALACAGPQTICVFVAKERFFGRVPSQRPPRLVCDDHQVAKRSRSMAQLFGRARRGSLPDAVEPVGVMPVGQAHLAVLHLHFLEELFRLAFKSSACRHRRQPTALADEHPAKISFQPGPGGDGLVKVNHLHPVLHVMEQDPIAIPAGQRWKPAAAGMNDLHRPAVFHPQGVLDHVGGVGMEPGRPKRPRSLRQTTTAPRRGTGWYGRADGRAATRRAPPTSPNPGRLAPARQAGRRSQAHRSGRSCRNPSVEHRAENARPSPSNSAKA